MRRSDPPGCRERLGATAIDRLRCLPFLLLTIHCSRFYSEHSPTRTLPKSEDMGRTEPGDLPKELRAIEPDRKNDFLNMGISRECPNDHFASVRLIRTKRNKPVHKNSHTTRSDLLAIHPLIVPPEYGRTRNRPPHPQQGFAPFWACAYTMEHGTKESTLHRR